MEDVLNFCKWKRTLFLKSQKKLNVVSWLASLAYLSLAQLSPRLFLISYQESRRITAEIKVTHRPVYLLVPDINCHLIKNFHFIIVSDR